MTLPTRDGLLQTKHPLWPTYASMIQRCYNPRNPGWKNYGKRGIKVCERWVTSFWNFVDDMGERPVGKTVERVDNDGIYSPANCVWGTHKQQLKNRRAHSTSRKQNVIYIQNRESN